MNKRKCFSAKTVLNELHRLKCQQNYLEKVNGAKKIIEKISTNNILAKQFLEKFETCRNDR